jgi:sugar/nucleoside kinase (ribokinase family)
VAVLKRGARGCTVFTEDARLDFAAVEAEVVDPTGAGDALAAGFLVGLEVPPAKPEAPGEDPGRLRQPVGGSLEEAARRGLDAAARCIAKVGSLP